MISTDPKTNSLHFLRGDRPKATPLFDSICNKNMDKCLLSALLVYINNKCAYSNETIRFMADSQFLALTIRRIMYDHLLLLLVLLQSRWRNETARHGR